jgi:hypothetical protein
MKKILYFLAGMMSLASCSDYEYDYSNLSDKNITFKVDEVSASVNNNMVGRAAPGVHEGWQQAVQAEAYGGKSMYLQSYVQPTESQVNVEGIAKGSRAAITTATLSSFGLLAYRYASGDAAATPNFMYNEEVTKVGSTWQTSEQYNWPANSDKIDFYAYAPYNGTGVTLSSQSATGAPVIDFTMNSSAASQIDLVTAVATGKDKSNASSGVSFTFGHALTTVKFVKGSDLLGTIESITLKNVYLSGKYTIGGSWNFTGKSTSDYEPAMNTSLMMIPQTFGSNASLEVVYNDGLTTHTLIYSLNGITWQAGETITYRVSSEEVSMLHVQNITFPIIHANFPKTAYANGDEAGLYVVDAGGTVKNSNVKLTYNGTAWSAASAMMFSPEYDYYVYYPYTSAGLANNGTAGAKMMSRATTHTAGDATSFFADGISSFTPQLDQSTTDNFISSDLQIAKGYVSVSDNISMQFEMVHAMGLAQFDLGTKNIGQEYYLSTDANYKWFVGSGGTATATSSFATGGYQPYSYATSNYLFWVKPGTATSINSAAELTDSWENALTFNVAANSLATKQTAYSARTAGGSSTQYTLQVGDILYSDGSLSHQSESLLSGKTPVAIVFMATTNANSPVTTTKDRQANANWKHGYAMALKFVHSSGTTIGTYKWGYSETVDHPNIISYPQGDFQSRIQDMDGYTNTTYLNSEDYPAGYAAATTYASQATAPTASSGWFLPSNGQFYYILKNLGNLSSTPNQLWGWNSLWPNVANNLNSILSKVGSDKYDSFPTVDGSGYTCSSETNAQYGYIVDVHDNGSIYFAGGGGKTYSYYVRPVLAF